MTAAHRPGAILTPRYRGARAVANFNAADARSRATHLRAGWLPSAGVGHCNSQTGRHGPEMPARRNRYLWGCAYATLAQTTGQPAEDWHEYFLGEHFGWETVEMLGRKKLRPVRRSSKLENGNG